MPHNPIVFTDKKEMRNWSRSQKMKGKRVALVPTMGYLHEGHFSLINEARIQCEVVIVSIYVNPTQFAPHEDLDKYPRDFEGDLKKLEPYKIDAVFHPRNLYSVSEHSSHETWIDVVNLQKRMEGKSRPHFFRGVSTVVSKLFNITEPDVAVFGKKDYQQWRIITKMVEDLDFDVQIIGVELVREKDGLALSSRNVYLSPDERHRALSLSQALAHAVQMAQQGAKLAREIEAETTRIIESSGGRVDYVELSYVENLEKAELVDKQAVLAVAVYFGSVRLIDNVELLPQ